MPTTRPRAAIRRTAGRAMRSAVVATAVFIPALLSPTAFAGIEEGRQKSQVCAACHGADGNSPAPVIPSIAGQPRQFIEMTLIMFREGRRVNEAMKPFTDKLSNADVRDLSQYYAAQKLAPPARKADAALVERGRAITDKNNCVTCHTATLVGQQHIPRLAGQHKDYLLEQLRGFKAAKRADFDGTMTSAAQALALEELELVAEYLATLQAP